MDKLKLNYLLILLISLFYCISCSNRSKLEVSFHVNEKDSIPPSYQVAVWLEKIDGSYVKTLFVSDYLSYGGFNIPTTCQIWSGKANWEQVDMEELDAATGATPAIGDMSFEFVCPEKDPPG